MNDDDSHRDSDEPESSFKPKDSGDSAPGGRREPVFTDFDEDEDYEEADRDTDYASAYEEESEDDEYLEPLDDEDPDDISTEWQVLGATGTQASTKRAGGNPWDVPGTSGASEEAPDEVDEYDTEPVEYESELDDNNLHDDPEDYDPELKPELPADKSALATDSDEEWDDEDDYPDEREEVPEQEAAHSWPLGLVIVGIVALVLLAAGGYGVIQQRSATQEEIRQLQATLATAASPAEVAASREAVREIEQRNENLVATVDRLSLENRRLSDTVAGLEKQLAPQQTALPQVAALYQAAAPKPAPAPKPAAATAKPKPASTSTGGDWFVNFSSYSQRTAAESWAKKLKPSAGKTIVAASTRDGKTLYRVRIIGLADRAAAQKVAGQLASDYKLPPLWVGSE
jgi:cell division septation protein DedD